MKVPELIKKIEKYLIKNNFGYINIKIKCIFTDQIFLILRINNIDKYGFSYIFKDSFLKNMSRLMKLLRNERKNNQIYKIVNTMNDIFYPNIDVEYIKEDEEKIEYIVKIFFRRRNSESFICLL